MGIITKQPFKIKEAFLLHLICARSTPKKTQKRISITHYSFHSIQEFFLLSASFNFFLSFDFRFFVWCRRAIYRPSSPAVLPTTTRSGCHWRRRKRSQIGRKFLLTSRRNLSGSPRTQSSTGSIGTPSWSGKNPLRPVLIPRIWILICIRNLIRIRSGFRWIWSRRRRLSDCRSLRTLPMSKRRIGVIASLETFGCFRNGQDPVENRFRQWSSLLLPRYRVWGK